VKLSFVVVAGLAALTIVVSPRPSAAQSAAQGPPHPRWEIPGFDFAPDGVYRVRARQIAQARAAGRAQLLRAGQPGLVMPAGPYGSGLAWAGTYPIPVLLGRPIGLSDPAFASAAQVQAKLFGASTFPISLTTYYQQQSHGLMTVTGQAYGWFPLPHDTTYYTGTGGCGGGVACPDGTAHLGQFVIDLLTAADAGVDFRQYDNDGADGIPNSLDDDGYVDLVALLHPQIGGECQLPTSVPSNLATGYRHIWSHRWDVISLSGSAFTTNDPSTAHGLIKIRDYFLTGAEGTGNLGCTPGAIMQVGIFAHEFGHGLGLPDFYDTGPALGGTQGLGDWDLMAGGSYNRALSPSFMSAFSRGELGWTTEVVLSATGVDTLSPTELGDTMFVVPSGTAGEYFLLENRQPLESDAFVHGPGLTIYHVDRTLYNQRLSFNTVNVGSIHAVALLEADGLRQLWCATCNNRGDAGDPYPGTSGNIALSPMTTPNNLRNSGATSGFRIDSISILAPSGPVRFRIRVGGESRIAADDPAAFIRVDAVSYTLFRDIFEPGSSHEVSVADTQLVAGDRTRLTFVSWSDGLAQTHTFIASASGDTITATLARAHQLIATFTAGGTIGYSPAADSSGTFVAEGTPVTLTATPSSGFLFAGWTGDTTFGTAVVTLPMGRPYTVSASFFTAADVVTQLLGPGAPLTPAQIQFLDARGNNNGSFDVGDFLAWVKATGAP
jgi:M6 family metalloprotease-like protein